MQGFDRCSFSGFGARAQAGGEPFDPRHGAVKARRSVFQRIRRTVR